MNRIQILIGTQHIQTSVRLPASKSISNRLLMIKALCTDEFSITNLSNSEDTLLLHDALENASAHDIFQMDNAGTPFRFLTAFFALTEGERVLTGATRMLERPIGLLVDALIGMGARITYLNQIGFPPIHIEGASLEGGTVNIAADISSQFISALLLIAPKLNKGIELHLQKSVASQPYIKMTLEVMRNYGITSSYEQNIIRIPPQKYVAKNSIVESDWSAAAFWYEIVALSSEADVELLGLQYDTSQGDAHVAEIFEKLGVETTYQANSILLKKSKPTVDFIEIDFLHIPDMFPSIIATCAALQIKFRFTGIENLSIKESNRVEAMISELGKCGYQFHYEKPHALLFHGECQPQPNASIQFDSHKDHRIVMALAPLCLYDLDVTISDAECVKKSYPNFFADLAQAGFFISDK